MINEKGIIEQYDLVIYPIEFVVVIGDMEEEVNKLYESAEEGYEGAYIAKPVNTGATYKVKEKETGVHCLMVWIKEKEQFVTSVVAHECGHAVLELWSAIGSEVSLTNQEPFCYTLGNLVRLAVGTFYQLPGIEPPTFRKDIKKTNIKKNGRKTKDSNP